MIGRAFASFLLAYLDINTLAAFFSFLSVWCHGRTGVLHAFDGRLGSSWMYTTAGRI